MLFPDDYAGIGTSGGYLHSLLTSVLEEGVWLSPQSI
jgi:hypothetical protein